jgi:hypothetical protein
MRGLVLVGLPGGGHGGDIYNGGTGTLLTTYGSKYQSTKPLSLPNY